MLKVRYVPGIGTTIVREVDGKESEVAIMRWSDGLDEAVEEAIKRDAHMICHAYNRYYKESLVK